MSWIEELPALGVGASLSFGMQPDPVALAAMDGGPDFIEYAGAVDVRLVRDHVRALHDSGVPVLYHPSCLNLCGPWPNPAGWLKAVDHHVRTVQSPWLAQDVAVCFVGSVPGYSIQLGYFVPPILTEDSLQEAILRVLEVRQTVSAPLLLEPPPATFRSGSLGMLTWLSRLAEATDCGLLLDAGHVYAHELLEGTAVWDGLAWDRVVEVHVAGGMIVERESGVRYLDAHDLPIQPEVWSVFERLVRSCPNLKAICVECEGAAAHTVLPQLDRVRQVAALHSPSQPLRARLRAVESPALPPTQTASKPPEAPTAELPEDTGYHALIRLLFDAELRETLASQPEDSPQPFELPAALSPLDHAGLALDAEGRETYLMSALCRSFPRSAALLSCWPDGEANLGRFLTSPAIFGRITDRTEAFGKHLDRLCSFSSSGDPTIDQVTATIVAAEQALASTAAAVRATILQGGTVPPPRPPGRAQRRHGRIEFGAHTAVVELPFPQAVLDAALEGLTSADAWQRISRNAVDSDRVYAVLRSRPTPVTVIARAYAAGHTIERAGAGGVAPTIDVAHRTVELRGSRARKLQAMVGERLDDLPPASQRWVRSLVEAGVVELH